MDVNDLRSISTVLSLTVFIGIVVWAWSRRNSRQFEEAAMLPFAEDAKATQASATEGEVR